MVFQCKVCNRYTANTDHDCSHRRSIKGRLVNKYHAFIRELAISLDKHIKSMEGKYWDKYVKDDSWE